VGRKKTNVGQCSVDGCEKDARQRCMCSRHYLSSWKHGDPLYVDEHPHGGTVEERFWRKVEKTDSCWLWTAQVTPKGYGRFYVDGRNRGAHEVAYELFIGPIPPGLEIDHVCHSDSDCVFINEECPHRRCVNPEHLEAITHAENLARRNGAPGPSPKDYCMRGHPMGGHNLMVRRRSSDGKLRRECRACSVDNTREWRAQKKAEMARCV
jgi:hypothetical protein